MAHEEFPNYPTLADAIEDAEKITVRWGHNSVRHLSAAQVASIVAALRASGSENAPIGAMCPVDGTCKKEPACVWPCDKLKPKKSHIDTERMDWLEMMHVEVRTPLVHGSASLFHASPEQGDGDETPSDIRKVIDYQRNGGKNPRGERDG